MANGKRLGVLALFLCAVLLFCACGGSPASSVTPLTDPAADAAPAEVPQEAVMALVTTESRYDTAFGQAVWQAVSRFTGERGLHSAVYKAEDGNPDAAKSTLSLAASGGAQLVVAMGESASIVCADAANEYPALDFILLDLPAGYGGPVTTSATWVEPDALSLGWTAGYTAVSTGMTDLLCLWDESEEGLPEGREYALGFILGCQDAARQQSADEEPVRLRVLGLAGEDPEADDAAVLELMAQRPQLVLSCFESWGRVSGWFEGMFGARLMAPLCQQDVPAGRLWALVELEPGEMVSALLAEWEAGDLSPGKLVKATADTGSARLAAGLSGGAQEDLDDAAARLAASGRMAALERAAAVQMEVFPDLAVVDFPNLHLMMLPRDAAPPDVSGGGGSRVQSQSQSAAPTPTPTPDPQPAPTDGGQAAPDPTPPPPEVDPGTGPDTSLPVESGGEGAGSLAQPAA